MSKARFSGLLLVSVLCVALGFNAVGSGDGGLEYLWSGVNNVDIFDEPADKLDQMLNVLAEADLRVLRIWIDFRLEMDADGEPMPDGTYDDGILEQIDNLMVRALEKGILLMITLHQSNWIDGRGYRISEDSYGWRNCKTPENVYNTVLETGVSREVYCPYYNRGWGNDYLTNESAKIAYKQRVHHILNHVNPHLGMPWKDLNDVVWAWELQNEIEYLSGSKEIEKAWLEEMATYVKTVDPDTHVALGALGSLGWENIEDADIYTDHFYGSDIMGDDPDSVSLEEHIRSFKETVGEPYGKLLLLEEFNPGDRPTKHVAGDGALEEEFETIMEVCRRNRIPWMFWELGDRYDEDDVWFKNRVKLEDGELVKYEDGRFWEAKIIPAARRVWRTQWGWITVGKRWGVHEIVGDRGTPVSFVDTFSMGLRGGYRFFDEGDPDSWVVRGGYLKITAGYGEDLWGGFPVKRGAPLLMRPALGSLYRVETFVCAYDPSEMRREAPPSYPVQPVNTQMGLFLFQDVDNWMFFGLTYHNFTVDGGRIEGDGLVVTKTEDGASSIIEENALTPDFVFLKIERRGDSWNFYWKIEYAQAWILFTTLDFDLGEHEVGVGVKTFNSILHAGPVEGYFDFFLMHWNFDVNGDSRIDMKDVSLAASSFGSRPEHPRWNSHTDVNQDGRVDLKDIALLSRRFGGTL